MSLDIKDAIISKRVDTKSSLDYQPKFFHLSNQIEKDEFSQILNKEGIQVFDNIYDQLAELIKIKNVSKKITDEELPGLIGDYIGDIPAYEFGLWVFYPWLNKLVHILDEEDFIAVRTNRNQHKITLEELKILREKKIGVIGLSVGQCIASVLALERCCGEIRLADFDDIQLSNLNRINTSLYNIGCFKVVQIARAISEIDPFIKVICFTDGMNESNADNFFLGNGKLDLLIEECDSIDVKVLARLKAKQYKIPVVMDTNDRGMIDIERYDLEQDYPLLHGLLNGIPLENLKDASQEKKLAILLKFFSFEKGSARGKAALFEIGQSLLAWPQIASSVYLGGAIATDVSRRILLDQLHVSGRYYVDIEGIIKEDEAPSYIPPDLKELSLDEMKQIAASVKINNDNAADVPLSVIEQIITDAGTAPSSGNDQPWKFLLKDKTLLLFHESSRSYSFGDYRNMSSYISLGGAIENAVLSAHHYGREISIDVFPDKKDIRCVAALNFKTSADASIEKHDFDDLYNSINQRCTNRKIEKNEPANDNTLDALASVIKSTNGAQISFITDKEKLKRLGYIVSSCDRIRIMNPQAHHEFFNREIMWDSAELERRKLGMDVNTLELPSQTIFALKTISEDKVMKVLRNVDGLKIFKNASITATENSAAMGLLTMPSYDKQDFLEGGRLSERLWLKSTQLGFAFHPMLIPIYLFPRILYGNNEGLTPQIAEELHQLRNDFMEIFPGDERRGEVFLFRIFKADEIKMRSLRLPLSKILYS